MSATTLSRTVNSVVDIRVGLNSQSIIRPLSIGTSWNYLRIGMRVSIDPAIYNASTNIKTTTFFIGACSGTTNGWNTGVNTTTHAVGVLVPYTGWSGVFPDLTTSGGVNGYRYYQLKGAKRVGTTITESSTYTQDVYLHSNDDYRASLFFVDIEKKTSPTNWNIKSIFLSSITTAHATSDDFQTSMSIPYASFSRTGYSVGSMTLAVDEATNGYLDSVNIFCNIPGNLEISEVGVYRFG